MRRRIHGRKLSPTSRVLLKGNHIRLSMRVVDPTLSFGQGRTLDH